MSLKKKSKFFKRFDVKITMMYTSLFFLLAMVLSVFLYYRLHHNLLKQVDSMLSDEIIELHNTINENNGQGKGINKGCAIFFSDIKQRKYFPLYFRVLTPEGVPLFQSENSLSIEFPDINHHSGPFTMKRQKSVLISEKSFFVPGLKKDFVVQMGTHVNRIEQIVHNLFSNTIIAMPVMLVLCICSGMFASYKIRTILKNIIIVTNRITTQNLSERLPVPQVEDEIQDLTLTVNSMMDRLETSISEIKQFSSDVSHELRNPLFALKGEIEVCLSKKRDAAEYRESLQICLERINILIKMVNDLFFITRFEHNRIHLNFDRIELCTMITDMHDFFSPIAQQKNIDLTISRCDKVIVWVDKVKTAQLLNNILDNALKYTPQNGVIDISLVQAEENKIELTIRDSGMGMPEDELDKIFNRFYQVDQSRGKIKSGAGLGLHICKKIIEAHGGTIQARLNPDKGTAFVIHLPVEQKQA